MDLVGVRNIGSAIDDIAGALESLAPREALAALELVMVAVRAQVEGDAASPPVPRIPARASSSSVVDETDDDGDDASDPPNDEETAIDRSIKGSAKSAQGLETKIRRVLLTIRDLGEKATTTGLAQRWKIEKGTVRFRVSQAVSRKLVEPPPRGGAGERPWRTTGKAIEWLEKHGGLNPKPGEIG